MSPKGFLTLAAATLVSLALAAYALVATDRHASGSPASGPAFPALVDRVNQIGSIEVRSASGTVTVLARDGLWRLPDKGGYPVETKRVRDLILGLAELRRVEAKTDRKDRLAKLELEDPGDKDAKSRQVTIRDSGGGVI